MRKFKFFLFPLKTDTEERVEAPFIAFDAENESVKGKENFLSIACAGKYVDSNHNIHPINRDYYEDRFAFQYDLMKIAMKGSGKNAFRLVGHNVDYDLKYITEIVDDDTRLSAGSRLITARLKAGSTKGIKVYDTGNFVRGSLEQWIIDLNMEEEHGIVKLPLSELKERNIMDAKATLILIKWIEKFMEDELKIPLQLTIGACSLYYFKKYFLKQGLIRNSQFLNDYERKSYKGGRVEVFKRGLREVRSYDVHKMYLSIMRDELVPLPQSGRYVKDSEGFDTIYKGKGQFIAHVKVKVPKQKIPPLPYFSIELNKLIFPTGTFIGYFTSVELRDAVENYGIKILKVYDYVYYKESVPLFKEFAKNIIELQKKYKDSGSPNLAYMIKTIGNSLYGKFGEKHGGGQWIKINDMVKNIPLEGLTTSFQGNEEYVYLPGSGKAKDSTHTFPCIPSFITSFGRVKLLKFLKAHEKDVVYGDTDSGHLEACGDTEDIPDGKEVGEFGFEYEETQIYYRPKMYGRIRKGIPEKAERIAEGKENDYFVFNRPFKRNEALRRGTEQNLWVDVMKKVCLEDDKRIWDGNESIAIHIGEEE